MREQRRGDELLASGHDFDGRQRQQPAERDVRVLTQAVLVAQVQDLVEGKTNGVSKSRHAMKHCVASASVRNPAAAS